MINNQPNCIMNRFGFVRVCAASPEVQPTNISFNLERIKNCIALASEKEVEMILFPELSLTGYTCADLFYQSNLLEEAKRGVSELITYSNSLNMVIVVGLPLMYKAALYNCAVVIYQGSVLGVVPKSYLPNNNEFYEKRWFRSGADLNSGSVISLFNRDIPFTPRQIFNINGVKYGIEICEDLWVPVPPSSYLAVNGADIILNLSASNEVTGKHKYLVDLIRNQSARCRSGYVYSSAGFGESSTDLAFSGNCIICENGMLLKESERFTLDDKLVVADIDVNLIRNERIKSATYSETDSPYDITEISVDKNADVPDFPSTNSLYRYISPIPFADGSEKDFKERREEITNIQTWGLAKRLKAIGCKNAIIGISGGLDSTLALLVTVAAFDKLNLDRKGIIAVTMPGFGTTSRTHSNARELMELLGVTILEIPIGEAVIQHLKDINHPEDSYDATYENSQARERTQILMDLANKYNGIVIGTGDLSELALGWCTYNGDQMSMYGVNASIPKTLVKFLVGQHSEAFDNKDIKRVLSDIIDTPISPELLPASSDDEILQKTEDLVGPYKLHDFFIFNMLRNNFSPSKIYYLATIAFKDEFDDTTIKKWLKTFYRRFFSQQFKRSCMPDGIKVGSVCLSPRGDWRMPSDVSAKLWIDEVDKL